VAKEGDQVNSFRENFESLLLRDHEARWKAIGSIIVAAATFGSFDTTVLNSSEQNSIALMGGVIILMSVVWVAWYCSFRTSQPLWPRVSVIMHPISRRAWIAQSSALIVVGLFPRTEARAAERILQQASDDPTNVRNIVAAAQILNRAEAAVIRISSAILAETGLKFVLAVERNPNAQIALDAYFDYRTSFLNANIPDSVLRRMQIHPLPPDWETDYYFAHRISEGRPVIEPYGSATAGEAARLNPLGANANQNRPIGDAFLRVKGGSIELDGMEIKNVVFENVSVYYYGWSASIENVSFVNCKIRIAPQPNSNVAMLLTGILSNRSVVFAASSPGAPPVGSPLHSAPAPSSIF
jgi:hypothetical protein